MNCLKSFYFAVSKTTPRKEVLCSWGCELLEKFLLRSIKNNYLIKNCFSIRVVNCLKSFYFAVSKTTMSRMSLSVLSLWIAWKVSTSQYQKQQFISKSSLNIVVNCLKSFYFAVSKTTWCTVGTATFWLWIAWKVSTSQYQKQLHRTSSFEMKSCELLEKFLLRSIKNNSVNIRRSQLVLWIAWKVSTSQYQKQHTCWKWLITKYMRMKIENKNTVILVESRPFVAGFFLFCQALNHRSKIRTAPVAAPAY